MHALGRRAPAGAPRVSALVVLAALANSACTNVLGLDGYRDAVVDAGLTQDLGDGGRSMGPDAPSAANPEAGAPVPAPDSSTTASCSGGATGLADPACDGGSSGARVDAAADAATADASGPATSDAGALATDGGAAAARDACPDAPPEASASVVPPDAAPPPGCAKGAAVLIESACTTVASFETTAAVCVAFKVSSVQGWNAANVPGRTATATGATTQGPVAAVDGNIPNQPGLVPGADGYVYFNFTAGDVSYSGMTCW